MNILQSKVTLLDGALGTMLQKSGIELDRVPDTVNIKHPETVTAIHRAYIDAGSSIIYTNTFSSNRYKSEGCGYSVAELVSAGVANARAAAEGTDTAVGLSVGPIGTLLEPNGSLSFDDAYDMFKEMAVAGENAGADIIVLETMSDLLEVKAGVLAVRENTKLPVFVTMTFEDTGRTFTGVSVPAMAVTLQALGVDALGFNCSLGPDKMKPMVKTLLEYTSLPVIVKANAGLPNLNSNEYDISPVEYAKYVAELIEMGVTFVGGCCGTTPEYIGELARLIPSLTVGERPTAKTSVVSSYGKHVEINRARVVGERINPTGKKRLKEALRASDTGYVVSQALAQIHQGADILDVNVGLPDIDEPYMMERCIRELQSISDIPLQIDSSNGEAVERALRIYNGRPLLNSVNGDDESLDTLLPLVKKYGAAVVGLTLDKAGIPETAEGRFALAEKIVKKATEFGIPKTDIFIDCLTLPVGVKQSQAKVTLDAMRLVRDGLGVGLILGVSNISFGLPKRELVNATFLTLALENGLKLAIVNPADEMLMNAIDAFNVIDASDEGCVSYIARHAGDEKKSVPEVGNAPSIEYSILNGLKDEAGKAAEVLLRDTAPLDVVNSAVIPALDKVGADFEGGKLFLPQLMRSAEAAQSAFEVIKSALFASGREASVSHGKIILATVQGDIHDIGKNIVKVILENYGFTVIDLGRDVPPERVVSEAVRTGAGLVGLSALMTTTVPAMAKTIQAIHDAGLNCKIMVGGAVLTNSYAIKIGADFYARDAKQSADIAKSVFGV